MVPYWASLVLAVGFMLAAQKFTKPGVKDSGISTSGRDGRIYARWGVVSSAVVFIALTGFRYGIGQDYFYTYVPYFNRVYLGLGQQDMELGFYALNQIVAFFTDDPFPVFMICSILFFSFTYAAIMRESSHPIFSVFLLFGMSYLFIYMNAMRQMVAVSMLLFSLRYIEGRRPIKFVACVIAASFFHLSSLLFLVAYYFPRMRIGVFACLGSILCFVAFRGPIASIINFVIAQTPYAGYIGSIFDTGETGNIIIAMNIVVLLFSAAIPKVFGKEYSDRYRLLLWCQLISTLIAILSGLVPLSQRVRWVFSLSSIILLPLAVDSIDNKNLKLVVQVTIVVLYVIYIAIAIGLWNGNNVVPYQSIFMKGTV